jgi:hypothetical protein
MSEHELGKLLGGFAADTLTAEERKLLYSAALQDQQLFNALADEQALKELLSDPDIRRRLLQALQKTRTSGTGDSLPWLDWFRRPAGLAFAGGLSAAALAVVLGVRIYQDSLKQAAQSVAAEESKPPAPPQAVEPQAKGKEHVAPAIDLPKKDTSIEKPSKREPSAPPPSKRERASDVARDSLKQRREQDEVRRQAQAPVTAPSKPVEEVISSADQKLAASAAPPATAPERKQIQAPAGGRIAAIATPGLSARALFYGEEPGRTDPGAVAKEQEQAMKPLAESASQANKPERPLERFSQLGKAAGTVAQSRPLGLRYSFVVREGDGREREVDIVTASKGIEPIFLTLEANQDAYLQIWRTVGSSIAQLQLPEKETGQVSLKMPAGHRQYIHLPVDREPATFTARLSLVPFGPITREGTARFDRSFLHQLQESITELNQTGSSERATYVVNQDPSKSVQITVDIILGR